MLKRKRQPSIVEGNRSNGDLLSRSSDNVGQVGNQFSSVNSKYRLSQNNVVSSTPLQLESFTPPPLPPHMNYWAPPPTPSLQYNSDSSSYMYFGHAMGGLPNTCLSSGPYDSRISPANMHYFAEFPNQYPFVGPSTFYSHEYIPIDSYMRTVPANRGLPQENSVHCPHSEEYIAAQGMYRLHSQEQNPQSGTFPAVPLYMEQQRMNLRHHQPCNNKNENNVRKIQSADKGTGELKMITHSSTSSDSTLSIPILSHQSATVSSSDILPYECNWRRCYCKFATITTLASHVNEHSIEAEARRVPGSSINCEWKDCIILPSKTSNWLARHLSMHVHVAKLKGRGLILQQTKALPSCTGRLERSASSLFAESPPLLCLWGNCHKELEKLDTFYDHVIRHLDEHGKHPSPLDYKKPYQCHWNGCSFFGQDKTRLREHIRIHTKERVIACPTCGAGFTRERMLVDHLNRKGARRERSDTSEISVTRRSAVAANFKGEPKIVTAKSKHGDPDQTKAHPINVHDVCTASLLARLWESIPIT